MPQTTWLILHGNIQKGPYTGEQLRQALSQNEILGTDLVLNQDRVTVTDLLLTLSDPAHALFDALQITKEKKGEKRKIPLAAEVWASMKRPQLPTAAAIVKPTLAKSVAAPPPLPTPIPGESTAPSPMRWKVPLGIALTALGIGLSFYFFRPKETPPTQRETAKAAAPKAANPATNTATGAAPFPLRAKTTPVPFSNPGLARKPASDSPPPDQQQQVQAEQPLPPLESVEEPRIEPPTPEVSQQSEPAPPHPDSMEINSPFGSAPASAPQE